MNVSVKKLAAVASEIPARMSYRQLWILNAAPRN
jgi:hypothetical protein